MAVPRPSRSSMSSPAPRRVLAMALVACFLAVLAPVHGQEAQEPTSGTDGMTVVTDPSGDVAPGVFGLTPPGADVLPLEHLDIVEVRFLPDTATDLRLEIDVAGRPDTVTEAAELASTNRFGCVFRWTYNNDAVYHFQNTVQMGLGALSAGADRQESRGSMSYVRQTDNWRSTWGYGGGRLVHDLATTTYALTIEKDVAYVADEHRPPGSGDRMTDMALHCGGEVGLVADVDDFVELEGIEHPLSFGGLQSSVVAVQFIDPSEELPPLPTSQARKETDPDDYWEPSFRSDSFTGTSGIEPGQTRSLEWRITNLHASKRIVRIESHFVGPGGLPLENAPEGWNITHPEHVEVKAGGSRFVRTFVTAPADAGYATLLPVELKATPIGHEDEPASDQRNLAVTPPFDVDNPTVHFHARKVEFGEPFTTALDTLDVRELTISTLETLPGWDRDGSSAIPLVGMADMASMPPLARAVRLDNESAVTFDVRFETDREQDVAYELFIEGSGKTGTIATRSGSVPANQDVEILLPLDRLDRSTIPQDTRIRAFIAWASEDFGPEQADPPRLIVGATSLTFPLVASEEAFAFTDGVALPSVMLDTGADDAAYVNPGTEHAFDLYVANDGTETDDLQLALVPEPPEGWTAALRPGATFRLAAGAQAPVSVVVTADESLAEGTVYEFHVEVTSKNDPNAKARIPLAAIVTALEVEEKPYEAKEDEVAPVDDVEQAPGVGAMILCLAVLAMVGAASRRRQQA